MIEANFWDNLVNEVESISINIRASDLRRFKASLKDKIFAMKTGSEIRRKINVTLEKEIQALKEKLEKADSLIRDYVFFLEYPSYDDHGNPNDIRRSDDLVEEGKYFLEERG